MKSYKANNKRIINRKSNGQFRETTLIDLGIGVCEKCSKMYSMDSSVFTVDSFIDPRKFNKHKTLCVDCMNDNNKKDE